MSNHEVSSTVAVALLYQTSQLGGHLKEALKELGAKVVYESLAADLDLDTLHSSGASVVVVNLDAETDAHIDHVYDLLDSGDFSVIFNDAAASAPLKGWDHARWARHLAAKILRRPEVASPPRPLDAQAVPTPVQKLADAIPTVAAPSAPLPPSTLSAPPAMLPDPTAVEIPIAVPSALKEAMDMGATSVETLKPLSNTPVRDVEPMLNLEDEFDFGSALDDQKAGGEHPELTLLDDDVTSQNFERGFASEIEALFAQTDEPVAELPEFMTQTEQEAEPMLGDQWQTFLDEDGDEPAASTLTITGSGISPEKGENDFLVTIDSFNKAAAKVPVSRDTKLFMSEPPAAESPSSAEIAMPSSWLLEPLEDEETPAVARPQPASMGSNADFGIERISAGEFLAPVVEETQAQQPSVMQESTFDLELMPLEEAMVPEVRSYESESWLIDDTSAKASSTKKPLVRPEPPSANIRHVFVLCASIGGPEAVREFLATFPSRFPALFVLVQHMSEEFLGLMAAQLAKTTTLTVRTPTHGERVGQGDVLVVPTAQRLQVDVDGVVALSQLPEATPTSPSIGLVLHDIGDAFGDKAGVVIFSGMASDALEGCQYIVDRGGIVWGQDPGTCVLSSMVDDAREAGVVSFIGTPEQLAKKLIAQAKQW